jgi:hypothetical protein
MAIVRAEHSFDNHFTQVPNAWLRDKRLSLKAIGLLAQLMSHAVGWNVSIRSLAEANDCGLDAIRTAVAELEQAGYLSRVQTREAGKFSEVTWRTNNPEEEFVEPSSEKPLSEKPLSDNPTPKKNNLQEQQEKEIYGWNEAFVEFWKLYPRKAGKSAALRAFQKACMAQGDAKTILEGARRYRDDPNRVDAFTAHATTWLNAGRWEDEPLPERVLSAAERKAREEAEFSARKAREAEFREQERQRLELERLETERNKRENPVEFCEHKRVAVICPKCNK